MKLRTALFSLIAIFGISNSHADNKPIENPVYNSLTLMAQGHMNAYGFAYMQQKKKEVALHNNAYITYLNSKVDQMTKEQMLLENAKLERSQLDEVCLNIYFDEIAIRTMGTAADRLKASYEDNKKKIKASNYDCEENLDRIFKDSILLKSQ